MNYSIGLDFGTNSVRAIVVDCADGNSLGSHVYGYAHGDNGVMGDPIELFDGRSDLIASNGSIPRTEFFNREG